jgi:hypothetical protein
MFFPVFRGPGMVEFTGYEIKPAFCQSPLALVKSPIFW